MQLDKLDRAVVNLKTLHRRASSYVVLAATSAAGAFLQMPLADQQSLVATLVDVLPFPVAALPVAALLAFVGLAVFPQNGLAQAIAKAVAMRMAKKAP